MSHVVLVLALVTAAVMVVGRFATHDADARRYPRWELIYGAALLLLVAVALGGLVFTSHVTLSAVAAWIVFVATVATYGRPGLWQVSAGAFLIGALVMALFGLHIPGALNAVLGLVPDAKQATAAILVVVAIAGVALAVSALRDTWASWREPDEPVSDEDVKHSRVGTVALRFHRHRHVALVAIGGTFLVVQGFLMVYGYYASGDTVHLDCNGPCPPGLPQIHVEHHLGLLQLWHIVLLLAVGVVVVLEAHLSNLARSKEARGQEEGIQWESVGPP